MIGPDRWELTESFIRCKILFCEHLIEVLFGKQPWNESHTSQFPHRSFFQLWETNFFLRRQSCWDQLSRISFPQNSWDLWSCGGPSSKCLLSWKEGLYPYAVATIYGLFNFRLPMLERLGESLHIHLPLEGLNVICEFTALVSFHVPHPNSPQHQDSVHKPKKTCLQEILT